MIPARLLRLKLAVWPRHERSRQGEQVGTARPALRIGTSGWVYKHWQGVFYPLRLPADRQLPYYAERFDTVEINFSYYRLPERRAFENWAAQTPADFCCAVKGSRFLTHMKKLKDPEEPLERLMERARGLGDKLGPLLFQLPPNWSANLARFEGFMAALAPYRPQRFAVEFRHRSWLNAAIYTLLERAGVALCLPVGPHVPLDRRLTAPWTYLRMHQGQHGAGYGEDELAHWAEQIRRFLDQGADTYVYFNNDPEGHAVRDAERLGQMLAG